MQEEYMKRMTECFKPIVKMEELGSITPRVVALINGALNKKDMMLKLEKLVDQYKDNGPQLLEAIKALYYQARETGEIINQ